MKKRPSIAEMGNLFDLPTEPERESPPTLPDMAARESALDVMRSWIVEAPAGSGKTGLLIQRYLKLLALPNVEQPEQVLAVTFTLKATGEIRERIVNELERVRRSDDPRDEFDRKTRQLAAAVLDRDQALSWGLLEHPRRLNVRTIDSICAEISRSLPVLSGSANLVPVENAKPLYQLAAERALMQLGGENSVLSKALSLLLLHRDGNLTQLRDLLSEMLSLRDQWGRLVPLGRELLDDDYLDGTVLTQIEQALNDVICTELTKLSSLMPNHLLQQISAVAGELGFNEGYRGQPSPISVWGGVSRPPTKTAQDLELWRAVVHLLTNKDGWRPELGLNGNHLRFVIDRQQKGRLREIINQLRGNDDLLVAIQRVKALPPAQYPTEQWLVLKALLRVLYRALAELQLVFAEQGQCDFIEQGLLARAALRRDSGVAETAFGTDIQHMLVDEMQDTSTSQYELIELLTQGWDGRSQTIFLVGDPKQSIYLFRQARVERFIRMMQTRRLGDLELECLHLTSNFRSQRDLVHTLNESFSQLFPREVDQEHPEEAPYVAADPIRDPELDNELSVVWHSCVLPSGLTEEERRRAQRRHSKQEALKVRKIVEDWQRRPLSPVRKTRWKIAVLVRNRKHLMDIVSEFKRNAGAGPIPFRAVNIEPLGERPEILDLFALTRALLHPADRVAFLAVLRAPWSGLELAQLHVLTGADDPALGELTLEELLIERGGDLSEESRKRVDKIHAILNAAAARNSRFRISEWVERTWRSLGADAYLTDDQIANANRYFELLDQLEQKKGVLDLGQLKDQLNELYAESVSPDDAIDLITIHGAKGLEWDVVIVPGLEKRNQTNRGRLLTWNEMTFTGEHTARVLFAPIAGKGHESEALNNWLNRIQRDRESAECRRLFYVACTRAREELHLFGAAAERSDGSLSLMAGSLLHAAWPAAEEHFVNVQAPAKPLIAPLVVTGTVSNPSLLLPQLAADAHEVKVTPSVLYRVPADFELKRRLAPSLTEETYLSPSLPRFERPEGSFEARALGNVVHIFLEALASRLVAGRSPQDLLIEISSWDSRITAILRNTGLAPEVVERHAIRVRTALENTLHDPAGLWILGPHIRATSEYALNSWDENRSGVRLDRIFCAGPEPFVFGKDYLWIVDFKTAQHTGDGLEEFLAVEREKYAPQMQAYAREMNKDSIGNNNLRVALYYPMLSRIIWWDPNTDRHG